MEAINPFNSKEFKEAILAKEGMGSGSSDDYEFYEDIDGEEKTDLKNIISGAPSIPGKAAKNLILDASMIAKTEKEKRAQEMELALNDIFTSYNKQYGIQLNLDLKSLSNTLAAVAVDPKSTRILELYTSRIYRNAKAVLSLHLIQRLSLVIDYVTRPENMLNQEQLSLPDMFLVIEKLISYIQTLGDLKDTMEISGDDLELKKLAEENSDLDMESEESKAVINDFMKLFNAEFNKKIV